jgi:hypothetical protein
VAAEGALGRLANEALFSAGRLIGITALGWWSLASSIPLKRADGHKPAGFTVRWWRARQWWLLRVSDVFLVVAVVGVLFIDLPLDAHEVATKLLARANTPSECKVSAIGAPDRLVRARPARCSCAPSDVRCREAANGASHGAPVRWHLPRHRQWLARHLSEDEQTDPPHPDLKRISVRVNAKLKGCPGVHGPNEQRR